MGNGNYKEIKLTVLISGSTTDGGAAAVVPTTNARIAAASPCWCICMEICERDVLETIVSAPLYELPLSPGKPGGTIKYLE